MPLANFGGWHFLIILLVVLLLFGATKLPALAKSVGQSAKILKSEMKSDDAATSSAARAGRPAGADPVGETPIYTAEPPTGADPAPEARPKP